MAVLSLPVLASTSGVPFAVLPALVLVPAVGALLVVCLPRRRPELLKLVAVATSVVVASGASVMPMHRPRGRAS